MLGHFGEMNLLKKCSIDKKDNINIKWEMIFLETLIGLVYN